MGLALAEPHVDDPTEQHEGLTFTIDQGLRWWVEHGHTVRIEYLAQWDQMRVYLAGVPGC